MMQLKQFQSHSDQHNLPLVSIITAAHNAEKFIDKTIQSILKQTYSNWELIITDDGSTDRTLTIISEYSQVNSKIKVIHNDIPQLQTIARIQAIGLSHGTYLAILDADDISLPQRLELQVAFLEKNTFVAAVGSDVELIDISGNVIGKKTKPELFQEIAYKMLLQTQFVHSAVCMRKDAYEKVGGYDKKNYAVYAEEFDLWHRFILAGYSLANLRETLIQYRIHATSLSQSDRTRIRTNLARSVSDKYINIFFPISRPQVELLTDMVNNDKLSTIDIVKALSLYKRLTRAYVTYKKLEREDTDFIWKLYTQKRNHVIKSHIKDLKKKYIF